MLYNYTKTQKKKDWVGRSERVLEKYLASLPQHRAPFFRGEELKPISQKRFPPKSASENLQADTSQPLKNTVWKEFQLSLKQEL